MELFKAFATLVLDTSQFEDKIRGASGTFKSLGSTITSGVGNIAKVMSTGLVAGASAGATAIGAITKSATENFAEYEQLVGGVETLFGAGGKSIEEYAASTGRTIAEAQSDYDALMRSQAAVIENAANAYKTAGMSANEYMETVTSFSASLLQSLGGDTAQASEYANRSIIDMSDNANKMGTSMEMIQNAYQGFAKQNYTMLDNLKLGYGGTQTEMQRLIADAAAMTDIQKELGVTVDASSMSFGNIVNAISVMQSSMGIAGTTYAEASGTISGSIATMQSAWSNLVTGMADENADFEMLVGNFVDSVATVGYNLLPTIDTALSGVADLIDQAFPAIMERVPAIISDFLPRVAESAVNIVKTLISGISDNQNSIFDTAIDVMNTLIDGFIELLPEIIVTGSMLLARLALGLVKAIPDIVRRIPEIVRAITNGFSAQSEDFVEIGRNIVQGLWNGIQSLGSWIGNQVKGFFSGIVDGVKDFLGIRSPSRLFISIGQFMLEGLEIGMENMAGEVMETISDIVSEIKERFSALNNLFGTRQDIGELQYQLWERTYGQVASAEEKYNKQLELLNEQQYEQQNIIEAATNAYEAIVAQYGENSSESLQYQKVLLQEQIAYQDLLDEINEVIEAQKEFEQLKSGNWSGKISFDNSATAKTTAEYINAVLGKDTQQNINLEATLTMPDGSTLARYYLPSFINEAKSNGTPILNPT